MRGRTYEGEKMKKIKMELEARRAWVEDTYRVDITGYTSREEAMHAIKKMLCWGENKKMTIDFCWCNDALCVVKFGYEKIG